MQELTSEYVTQQIAAPWAEIDPNSFSQCIAYLRKTGLLDQVDFIIGNMEQIRATLDEYRNQAVLDLGITVPEERKPIADMLSRVEIYKYRQNWQGFVVLANDSLRKRGFISQINIAPYAIEEKMITLKQARTGKSILEHLLNINLIQEEQIYIKKYAALSKNSVESAFKSIVIAMREITSNPTETEPFDKGRICLEALGYPKITLTDKDSSAIANMLFKELLAAEAILSVYEIRNNGISAVNDALSSIISARFQYGKILV